MDMGGFGCKLVVGGEAAEQDDLGTSVRVDVSVLDPGSSPGVIGVAVPPAGSADCSMNTPRLPHKVTRSGALTWSGGRPQGAGA